MKKQFLLFCVTLFTVLGFNSYGQATVSISSGLTTDTVCYGTTINFTATPVPASSYGYIWNVNGSYAGPSSATYNTSTLPTGVDKVYCLLTNAAGDTIYGVSDTLTVTVDTLPVIFPITSSVTPAGVCIGDTLNLTDIALGGIWVSSNPVAASVSSIGTVTGLSLPVGGGPGGPSVRVYYIMTNSCGSDSANIRVRIAQPAGAIVISSTTICIDSSVTISDAAGGGAWSSSDSTIAAVGVNFTLGPPPALIEQVTGVAVGNVTISYTGTNACGPYTETTNISVVDCGTTAVHSVASIADGCKVYPNPSTGVISILANSSKYATANCTITNMVGAQVKNAVINTNQEATLELNVPAGVYFMSISAGTETYTTKVVIME